MGLGWRTVKANDLGVPSICIVVVVVVVLVGLLRPHIFQFGIELGTKAIELSQIEGPKIQKEIPIDQFLVNIEKVNGDLVALGISQQDLRS